MTRRTGLALQRLKKRPEFLRVASTARKWVGPGLIVQVRARGAAEALPAEALPAESIRVGFTVSRKVGGAVARNRARRRLRAVAEKVMPELALPGHDYVLIGRPATVRRAFDALVGDLESALRRLAKPRRNAQ